VGKESETAGARPKAIAPEAIDYEQFLEASVKAVTRALEARGFEVQEEEKETGSAPSATARLTLPWDIIIGLILAQPRP
jgi:hypothetical protein